MDNRDRLAKDVAKTVGLPTKVAEAVVDSQFRMAREMVQNGSDRSVYFRKLGYLVPASVRYDITGQHFAAVNEKIANKQQKGDDPVTFN